MPAHPLQLPWLPSPLKMPSFSKRSAAIHWFPGHSNSVVLLAKLHFHGHAKYNIYMSCFGLTPVVYFIPSRQHIFESGLQKHPTACELNMKEQTTSTSRKMPISTSMGTLHAPSSPMHTLLRF